MHKLKVNNKNLYKLQKKKYFFKNIFYWKTVCSGNLETINNYIKLLR